MGVQGSESFVLWDCDETVSYESQSGESEQKTNRMKLQIGFFTVEKNTTSISIKTNVNKHQTSVFIKIDINISTHKINF